MGGIQTQCDEKKELQQQNKTFSGLSHAAQRSGRTRVKTTGFTSLKALDTFGNNVKDQ